MRFENQAVLVSGAGRGIGREIALSFAREGADIGFAEVNEETASATANEIRKFGRRVFFSRTDVSDHDQVQQFIAGDWGWVAGKAETLTAARATAMPAERVRASMIGSASAPASADEPLILTSNRLRRGL